MLSICLFANKFKGKIVHKLLHTVPTITLAALSCLTPYSAHAELLDFNDANNLGVTLGGQTMWDDRGGGHLWNENSNFDDFIFFSSATYVNSFEMNARAWLGFTNINESIGEIDISAQNALNETVWETTVDLIDYADWGNWLTVDVETADITQLTFFAPGVMPFWPSIDNMTINEVPIPGAIWLFGSGLIALFGMRSARLRR